MIETKPPSVLRLLVVDDHEVVRGGLVALLERRAAFSVVAQVGTAAEAIEAARRLQPELEHAARCSLWPHDPRAALSPFTVRGRPKGS